MAHASLVLGQTTPPAAATPSPAASPTLLDKVKKRDLERQKEEKEKLLSSLKEEFNKADQQAIQLQTAIKATESLLNDTTNNLQALTVQAERFKILADLTGLRIESEARKIEGLKLLKDAQLKDAEVLEKKIEDLNAQVDLTEYEKDRLTSGPTPVPAGGSGKKTSAPASVPDAGSDKRKARDKTLTALNQAIKAADEIHAAVSVKLEAADLATVKANRKAVELGIVEGTDTATKANASPTPANANPTPQ